MPAGLTARGQVQGVGDRLVERFDDQSSGGLGNESTPGRAPDLVAHDSKAVAFFGKAQHRQHEVLAARSVDPSSTQNQVVRTSLAHERFSSLLGSSISRNGCDCGAFGVRLGRTPVEHIVGGVVHEQRAEFPGFLGHGGR